VNLGNGNFAPRSFNPIPRESSGLRLADLEGDGDIDAFSVSRYGGPLVVLRNRGDATFEQAELFTGNVYPSGLAVADFDLDGDVDAIIAPYATGGLVLVKNRCR
jgi:hypothetical protein